MRDLQWQCILVALFLMFALGTPELVLPAQSVPGLKESMYTRLEGTPCVRLNTLSGPTGCGNPGRDVVSAPLQRISEEWERELKGIQGKRVLLVPLDVLPSILSAIKEDDNLKESIVGIAVEDPGGRTIPAFSPASHFPQSHFAHPSQRAHQWNPNGFALASKFYNLPIALLSNTSTLSLRAFAEYNKNREFSFPLYMVQFDMVMQTTRTDTLTSDACIKQKTCLPFGGYSVISAIPYINTTAPTPTSKQVILTLATIDAASFFRDSAVGADSPLSGAIALLAAVDSISNALINLGLHQLPTQLVFGFLTGESWGYLGSRGLLKEFSLHSQSLEGIDLKNIHQVLEVGQVGQVLRRSNVSPRRTISSDAAQLFAHLTPNSTDPSLMTQDSTPPSLMTVLTRAATSMAPHVSLNTPTDPDQGLPPSSLLVLNQEVDGLSGVVLEEFDSHFKNPFYDSFLDGSDNVDVEGISAVATLISRALLSIAGVPEAEAFQVESNHTLVEQLVQCLLSKTPGLMCQLASELITPAASVPNHYVGVLFAKPELNPPAWAVSDTSRFIWNFLGQTTGRFGAGRGGSAAFEGDNGTSGSRAARTEITVSENEECSTSCEAPGQICVGSRADHKGRCVFSSTRYVVAMSPRVVYNDSGWEVKEPRPGNVLDAVDPVWTESFWQELTFRAYLKDSAQMESFVLGLGMVVFAVSLIVASVGQTWVQKHLKVA